MSFEEGIIEFGSRSRDILSSLGLPTPTRPSKELIFPSDLGALHDGELGEHLSYWSSLCAYAHQKVAVLEGSLILVKEECEEAYELRLYRLSNKYKSITEAKNAVLSTTIVRSLKKRIATIEADLKVLKSVLVGYDLKNSAISREITRRNNERALRDG